MLHTLSLNGFRGFESYRLSGLARVNLLVGKNNLGLRNSKRRLSINTYGDGTKRLLALRLSFVGAENGVLLVDDIDAGFHWTVMEEIWKLVIEVANRLNVQVFAATHSIDCIQGLGSLLRNRPDLEGEVSLQRVTRSLSRAVCLQGDQIKIAMKQDIEVR